MPSAPIVPRAPTVTPVGERWKHVLYGLSGQAVLIDIPTNEEYSNYVAEVWDEDAYSFIEGYEQIRAAMIEKAELTHEFDGLSFKPIPRTEFHVTLTESSAENPMGQQQDNLFYSVTTSTGEAYVFPSECPIAGKLAPQFDAKRAAFYISSALGVWRVTADGVSKKLTTDEYGGRHYSWHTEAAFSPEVGWSRLFWVSNAELSPDKQYIIYCTNRDCYADLNNNLSVWRIDLETGVEQRLLEGNAINTIDGFVTDNLAIINSRLLLDVSTGAVIPLTLPELPNRSVNAAGFGYIVCTSYKEEDNGLSTLHIFCAEPKNGTLKEVFVEQGYFTNFGFSPSGNFAYAGYGTDPERGVETLMLFDFEANTVRFLEDVLGAAYQQLGGDAVIRANWLAEW